MKFILSSNHVFFLTTNLISRWPLKLSKRGVFIRWNNWTLALDWAECVEAVDSKVETKFWLHAFFWDWRILVSKLHPQFRYTWNTLFDEIFRVQVPGLEKDAGNQFKLNASIWNNWIKKSNTQFHSLPINISTEKRVHLASSYIYYIF